MDIKEIALKLLAKEYPGMRKENQTFMVEFAEALVAEIAKQNEPIWWHKEFAPDDHIFYSQTEDQPVGCVPLYTFPPTAEQIANETAEAIAEYFRNQDHYCLATEIESGAWKEFKQS